MLTSERELGRGKISKMAENALTKKLGSVSGKQAEA